MKTILISLISEQTIPNILVAIHYKPDILWFVSTKKMEDDRKTDCIENTLKLRGLLSSKDNVKKEIVDQNSLTDCMNKIEALLEKVDGEVEYIVNITGGNKIMALAAYEIFREIGQKVIIGYMPLGKNEFIQIFPRKKPLKSNNIKEWLTIEEYLMSYGFRIQNKEANSKILSLKDSAKWILDNYEQLKGVLGFLYKHLRDKKKDKKYCMTAEFDRDMTRVEKEMFERHGFKIEGKVVSKELTKGETAFFTGGWLEEYVFNEVYRLAEDGVLDDAKIGIKIKRLSGAENELDIAFMRENNFYHIECKTLGDDEEKGIIRDEVYKKGAISTLLGKGGKNAFICTTHEQIHEHLSKRAADYGIEILPRHQVKEIRKWILEKFGGDR